MKNRKGINYTSIIEFIGITILLAIILFASLPLAIQIWKDFGTSKTSTMSMYLRFRNLEQTNPSCLIETWHNYCLANNTKPQTKVMNGGFLGGEYEAKLCVGDFGEERFVYTDEMLSKCEGEK